MEKPRIPPDSNDWSRTTPPGKCEFILRFPPVDEGHAAWFESGRRCPCPAPNTFKAARRPWPKRCMDVLRDGVKPSAARQGACLAGGGTRPRTGPARAAGLRGGICHGGAGYGGAALALDFREGRRIQQRYGSHDANHRETSPRESQGWALDVPTLRCLLRSSSDPMSCCSCGDASTGFSDGWRTDCPERT